MDINQFVSLYPRLYHMAEVGAWPSIKKHGLLSTRAVLNLHGVAGKERHQYEKNYRPEKMTVGSGKSAIVLRDQKPMPPNRLYRALTDGSTPEQWYQLLNGKVFMWSSNWQLQTQGRVRTIRPKQKSTCGQCRSAFGAASKTGG